MLYQNQNQHGGDIYSRTIRLDYSVSINPYGTSPAVIRAIRDAAAEVCHYPDPACRELVRAIAAYEHVPQSMVLCGNGAAELIWAYCSAVVRLSGKCSGEGSDASRRESASKAVLAAPTFSEYELGLLSAGAEVCRYKLKKENGFLLDDGFLQFLRKEQPDDVFLCSPNNPDGRLIPPDLMSAILELSSAQGFRLFVDECFIDLSDGGTSLKDRLLEHRELFLLKAFTKNYGMAGVRLGYCLCADADLLAAMAGTVQPWNVSVPAQAAGIAALSDREFLEKTRRMIPSERAWLSKALESLGLTVYPSEANYILAEGPPGLDEALKEQGILIRSCSNFYGLGPGWYRIAVKLHEENEQLIETMQSVLTRS